MSLTIINKLPLTCLLLVGIYLQCKQEIYCDFPEPDFALTLHFDDTTYTLMAGVDGYYMFTGFETTADSQVSFGVLAPAACSTLSCPGEFKLEIWKGDIINASALGFFNPGDYPYRSFDAGPTDGGIYLHFVDQSATRWTSNRKPQDGDAFFKIRHVEPYLNNEKGQRTMLINFEFKLVLEDEQGRQRVVSGGGNFAVAHP
jgi:hypothetical protein